MKVFLGGTCANSNWREYVMPRLKCGYFNPVVEDWTPTCQEEEERQKTICDYHLYVITPKMKGCFSIAESVNDSLRLKPGHCVFCITKEDDDDDFNVAELKSLKATENMIKNNGGVVLNSLDEVIEYLNSRINYVTIRVKKLHPDAELPVKAEGHDDDFCFDVKAVTCEEVAPNVYKYGTGLAFEIVRDDGLSEIITDIDGRARSSVWKTGMVLSNCVATIDEPYRGEVSAVFYHIFTNMPKYEVGDRIMQICLGKTQRIKFELVNELSKTVRGTGAYGSTGK